MFYNVSVLFFLNKNNYMKFDLNIFSMAGFIIILITLQEEIMH